MAFRGKSGMMRKSSWNWVVGPLSVLLLAQYLLLLGPPPGVEWPLADPSHIGYLSGFERRYVMLHPDVGQLWNLFGLVLLIGQYRGHVCRMVDRDCVPQTPSLSVLLLARAQAVAKARHQLDEDSIVALKQLLPPPAKTDFMEPPRSLTSQLLALWFLLPPYAVLFCMFLHAIKGRGDGSDQEGLALVNLIELLITMSLFHSPSHLTWNGNRRWRFIPTLYFGLLILSFALTVPWLHTAVQGSRFLRVLGTEGMGADGRSHAEADCLYLLLLLLLSYIQYLNYDNMRFVFVLDRKSVV